MPLPPAGELRISEVTHSSMRLTWDAAPGNVRKYIITYKREDGDLKEVIKMCNSHSRDHQMSHEVILIIIKKKTVLEHTLPVKVLKEINTLSKDALN